MKTSGVMTSCVWTSSVKTSCVWTSSGVDKLCVTGGATGAGGGGGGGRDAEPKTRTPHKDVGKNNKNRRMLSQSTTDYRMVPNNGAIHPGGCGGKLCCNFVSTSQRTPAM